VVAKRGKRSATVTWAQGSDGGSPLTAQVLYAYTGNRQVAALLISPSWTSVKVTGLRPGTRYSFSVLAVNANGPSPESRRSAAVIPTR
jgi:hypothetical protein